MQCPFPVRIKNPAIVQKVGVPIDVLPDGSRVYSDGEVLSEYISVPCGKCVVCQNARRDAWAARIELETRQHVSTWFVTLTYNEESVPPFLCKKDLQNFFKRLRKKISCRHFSCGEYGSQFDRPHYHSIIWFDTQVDFNTCYSLVLQSWPFGFITVSEATHDRMRYVAKYTVKSIYDFPESFPKPFAQMSRRPGVGSSWFETNVSYFHDFLVLESGAREQLPRYFLDKLDPVEVVRIKRGKREYAEHMEPVSDSEKQLRAINLERRLRRQYIRKYGK